MSLAVLDPNVFVSGLLAPKGAPADVLRAWRAGEFEVVTSPLLISELERVLRYPKLRKRISVDRATAFLEWLTATAAEHPDPAVPADARLRSADPDDDYLIALAHARSAAIVSGDHHLLDLADRLPVFSPRDWLTHLDKIR